LRRLIVRRAFPEQFEHWVGRHIRLALVSPIRRSFGSIRGTRFVVSFSILHFAF
jgi:hypothetical protein